MKLQKPRTKKQHFVPRFYLAQFADQEGMVWNYDISENVVRPATPENTAVETNFYSILNNDGEYNDEIESWLQGVEGTAAAIYPKLLKGEKLEGQEKADFAVFVSSLYARSPAIVTAYAELTGYLAQHITNVTLKDRSRFENIMNQMDAEKGKTTTQTQRDEAFAFMRDKSRYVLHVDRKRGLPALAVADRLTELFLEMAWTVLESRNQHLITSDNPVVQVNPSNDHHPIYGGGGFLNKRTNVSLPLSPTKLLTMSWVPNSNRGIQQIDKQRGRFFNLQRAHFAERYLYSSQRDAGIQALGQKYKTPGLRMQVSGMDNLAPVVVKRKLSK